MSGQQQPEPLQRLLMEVQGLRREVAQLYRHINERLDARVAAFRPLGRMRFEDRDYPVPADCDYYLRRRYGSWRQLPGDAGRITHQVRFGVEDMEQLRAFRSRHGG